MEIQMGAMKRIYQARTEGKPTPGRTRVEQAAWRRLLNSRDQVEPGGHGEDRRPGPGRELLMPTRVLVTGCRHWTCRELARRVIARLVDRHGPKITIIHGAASGVDSAFEDEADSACLDTQTFPASWGVHGKRAGPIRNQQMVDSGADFCIAVHRDLANSKGTRDCVRRCLAAGIPVWHISAEDAEPVRITEI